MTHMLLEACPRCAGDVRLMRDLDGETATCLQCGRELALAKSRVRPAQGRWTAA
jgi:uncharacterized protein (DUF983 family)